MNLRKLAKGKPCMVRIPGICNGNSETTVLCHVRMVGISGMGLKSPDLIATWGCSDCHRWADSHGDEGRNALLAGMARTIHELIRSGVIAS